MIFPINVFEAPPISDFWKKKKNISKGVSATFDIKEWNMADDDVLMDVLAEDNEVYIMQYSVDKKTILKKFTPTKTYFYHLGWFPSYFFSGAKTSFGVLKKLSKTMMVYGPLLIDLKNFVLSMYCNPMKVRFKYFTDRGMSIFDVSTVVLSPTSWIYIESFPYGSKGWKQRIALYQFTSPMNCLPCNIIKELLELSGKDTKAFTCKVEEDNYAKVDYLWRDWVSEQDTDNLKSMSITEGALTNTKPIQFTNNIDKCITLMKQVMNMIGVKVVTARSAKIFEDYYTECDAGKLNSFVSVVIANKRAEQIRRKNIELDNIDALNKIMTDLTTVYTDIVKLIRDVKKFSKDNDDVFKFVRGVLVEEAIDIIKMNINMRDVYDKVEQGENAWDVVGVYNDSMIKHLVESIPFPTGEPSINYQMVKRKVSTSTRFSQDINYVCMGPLGCIKEIEFGYIKNVFDTIVRTDVIDEDNILLWGFEDLNAKHLPSMHTCQYNKPIYVYHIYLLNVSTKKAKHIKTFDLEDDFVPLDTGSIAVNGVIKKDFLIFRDYYIASFSLSKLSAIKIDYIEVKKPLTGISYIKESRSTFINTNINVMSSWMYSTHYHSSLPSLPDGKRGPKDISFAVYGSDWLSTK